MNEVALIGSSATILVIAFTIIWVKDGWHEAATVIGLTLATIAGLIAVLVFWTWVTAGAS